MIKTIIFDFDGLLVDSEPMWFRAIQELFNDFNMEWSWDHQKYTMGSSTQTWVNYMYELLKDHLEKNQILESVISKMKRLYESDQVKSMKGADEALKYCLINNYKTGLASGSYKELLLIGVQVKGWRNYFNEILSTDDLANGKPHPDIYLEICKKLGITPSDAVILEDSKNGMKAGIAAGAHVIAVPSIEVEIPQDILDQCSRVIPTLHDFPEALENLIK